MKWYQIRCRQSVADPPWLCPQANAQLGSPRREPDKVKPEEVTAPVQELVELDGHEKLWKRPFR